MLTRDGVMAVAAVDVEDDDELAGLDDRAGLVHAAVATRRAATVATTSRLGRPAVAAPFSGDNPTLLAPTAPARGQLPTSDRPRVTTPPPVEIQPRNAAAVCAVSSVPR
jgi:hypothetical protein